MTDRSSSSIGIGFRSLLLILFIGLKLTGFITWSWIWVLSPIWISAISAIVLYLFSLLFNSIANYLENNS
jgi:hypothetical protein